MKSMKPKFIRTIKTKDHLGKEIKVDEYKERFKLKAMEFNGDYIVEGATLYKYKNFPVTKKGNKFVLYSEVWGPIDLYITEN